MMRNVQWRLIAAVACVLLALAGGVLAQTTAQPPQHGVAPATHHDGHHWTYEGAGGPQKWGSLDPAFSACGLGKHQSPVDIHDALAADLPAIVFAYRPSPLKIIDNGHTIQLNFAPGSSITVGQETYALVQMHFHHPCENTLDKRAFPMEAHLVHKDVLGHLAVVAVLLQQGKASAFIDRLWHDMPTVKEKEQAPAGVTVDPSELLPQDRGYDTFPGSLTTPPCSEGVTWYVLRTPVEVGAEQVNRFAQIYKMNARPVQPLNDRVVKATR
jgi:carbonic anhydrase